MEIDVKKTWSFYLPRIGPVGCIDPEYLEFSVIWMDETRKITEKILKTYCVTV